MAINKKKEQPYRYIEMKKEAHSNFMGGPSYDISSPLLRLICMSASSFFGEPMYYKGMRPVRVNKGRSMHSRRSQLGDRQREYLRKTLNAIDDYEWRNMTPQGAMEKAIDEALDHDPVATLEWAAALRREEFIRATPQVILVRAAQHPKVRGTGLIRQYAPRITARADEPATQLAYLLAAYGKPVPNALKRAWQDYLLKANEYQLAKYRMDNRVVKTVDVANLAFGFGGKNQDGAVGKLLRGELSLGGDIRTWESIISGGGTWEEAIDVMGHMALLRNIRNFVSKKVPTELWRKKLVATAERGKQLPFRYLSAFNANRNAPGAVLDAIEECFELSVGNLPTLNGRSLVLSDNSGSAHGTPISELSTMTVAQIGNLMGVLTAMISDEGVVGAFGDRLKTKEIRKRASIMDQTNQIHRIGETVGGGTEHGIWLALDKAIKEREHWDNIFVYSDMQAGHGGLYGDDKHAYKSYVWPDRDFHRYIDVPKLVAEYRNKVNPKVNVFLVQIAGYEDTLLPEYFDRTYIIGGWSGSILKFAKRMIDTADCYQQ
jgi:hypothetical protein